jgi:hypothetical protein
VVAAAVKNKIYNTDKELQEVLETDLAGCLPKEYFLGGDLDESVFYEGEKYPLAKTFNKDLYYWKVEDFKRRLANDLQGQDDFYQEEEEEKPFTLDDFVGMFGFRPMKNDPIC